MKRVPLALAVPLVLIGCGEDKAADENAAALRRAAEQGDPEAAALLRNAAEPGADIEVPAAGNRQ